MESQASTIHQLIAKALLMLGLILITLNIGGWMKKHQFKYFGETAMCISVGLATSVVFRVVDFFIVEDVLHDVQLSTNFFYMVLLPPIIFEGGYSVQRLEFFRNLPVILSLAFFGGIYSTIVVAVVFYLFGLLMPQQISVVDALIFGSLISSTDPVTILAMLPPETDKKLYMIIFGESALNDAVAIILYRFFAKIADPAIPLTGGQFLLSLLESLVVFLGSVAVGFLMGALFAKLIKHQKLTHEAEIYEVTMMLVFAYSSYLLAEVCSLSGIISVFFSGLCMAHYAKPNMTGISSMVAKNIMRIFSTVCDVFIFLYLGMGLFAFPVAIYSVLMITGALFAIALGRSHVFLVCSVKNLMNRRPDAQITLGKQLFIWFSGLRGAVSFALAVQLLDNEFMPDYSKSLIFGTAVIVIAITVFGLNLLTPPLIQKLDITTKEIRREEEEEELLPPEEVGKLGKLRRFDEKYIKPILCIRPDLGRQRKSIPEETLEKSGYIELGTTSIH